MGITMAHLKLFFKVLGLFPLKANFQNRPAEQHLMRSVIFLVLLTHLLSCNGDGPASSNRYPKEVSKILKGNCASAGCHTAESKDAAAGLNLETWDALFEGARGGSAVVPYSPDQSFLLYSINVDSTLGPVLKPTMPFGQPALEAIDYQLIRRWILNGARNRDQEERFPPVADRRKWYVGHLGCELVAVLDAETKQVMRYVDIGSSEAFNENLLNVCVAPDAQFFYVAFSAYNSTLDKYSTLTDARVAAIPLGHPGWTHLSITLDSKLGFLVSLSTNEIAVIDLENERMAGPPYSLSANIYNTTIHPTRTQVYCPANANSHLIVHDYNSAGTLSNRHNVDLVQNIPPMSAGQLMPLQVAFLPDGSKYFVACLNSKEIRVFDGLTDVLLEVIALPASPVNLALSPSTGQLFATCPDDVVSFPDPSKHGSVAVVDVATSQLVGMRYVGFQPYALTVDEVSGYLIVAARNQLQNGPAQHHASSCGGRNGYLSLLDLHTLSLVADFKPELSVDPVSVAVKY
jgi:DNA-binding beta-propeller fold protein YncE